MPWRNDASPARGRPLHAEKISGSVLEKKETGHGASSELRYLRGNYKAQVSFGVDLRIHRPEKKFSMCALSRYTNEKRAGRILCAPNYDGIALGHEDGKVGWTKLSTSKLQVQNSWASSPNIGYHDDWVVMCATPGKGNNKLRVYMNGELLVNRTSVPVVGQPGLGINYPEETCSDRHSGDWAIAEVMIWERALHHREFQVVNAYLDSLLKEGVSSTERHFSTEKQVD